MSDIVAATDVARRSPLRIAAFALSCGAGVAAAVLALGLVPGGDEPVPHVERPRIDPAAFDFPTRYSLRPMPDTRVRLYTVASEAAAFRLERWIMQSSYVELTEGRGADGYVIMVLNEYVTFETIEHLNLARIAHGELPYRVVDARAIH